MELEQIIALLTSSDAYLIAAGFVFLAVLLATKVPAVSAKLDTPAKRAWLALGLSVAPALGAALVSHAPIGRIVAIAATALLAGLAPDAMGRQAAALDAPKDSEAK